MEVETFKGGYRYNFSYLIHNNGKGIVIDPFEDISIYLDKAKELNIEIIGVLNTHEHWDHLEGNPAFEELGIKILPNDKDLELNGEKIKVIKTPGHSEKSVCFLIGSKIFTGDILFVGKIGGTWSEEGTKEQIKSLKKLMKTGPKYFLISCSLFTSICYKTTSFYNYKKWIRESFSKQKLKNS